MIVLDTTVLAYAVGAGHRFCEPCRQLMDGIEAGVVTATTTPEVLQEFAHIRSRRRSRDDAVELAEAFADLLAPLITVDEQALRSGLSIFREQPCLGSFDAVLIAAAAHGATSSVARTSANGASASGGSASIWGCDCWSVVTRYTW